MVNSESETTIISYQNTFGVEPWGFGRLGFTSTLPMVLGSAVSLVGALTILGVPAAVVALIVVANDFCAVAGKGKKVKPPRDILQLKDGAWSLATGRALPPASEPINEDNEPAITVQAQTVEASTLQPAKDIDRSTYPNSPWGAPSTPKPEPQPVPANVPANVPSEPVSNFGKPPESEPVASLLTDFEKEQEAIIEERVQERLKNKSVPAQPSQGIVEELFIKEDGYFRSWFVMAPTGGGKGVFLCYASIMAKAKMPGVSIWAIDPKSDPSEYSRWAHIPESQRYHYSALRPNYDRESQNLVKGGIKNILEGYSADRAPYKILIVDELPAILRSLGSNARNTLRYLNAIASMGRSSNSVVWLFSNGIGLQQNGITSADRSYYHTMYLSTARKLAPIVGYDKFEGPKIAADDAVFADTGRAAWASTKDEWESVPTSYFDVVSRLPQVSPLPAGFGTGTYKDSEGEVALANLADELAEALEQSNKKRADMEALVKETDFAYLLEKGDAATTLQTLATGLKKYPDVVTVRKVQMRWVVAMPKLSATEPALANSGEAPFTFDFL
jgi:hypothetical protein